MDTSGLITSAAASSSQSVPDLNLTATAHDMWNRISSQLGFTSDSDTACFLIQHYLDCVAGFVSALSCSVCQTSLALYCPQCKESYTLSNVSFVSDRKKASDVVRKPEPCNNVVAASETSKFHVDKEFPPTDTREGELTDQGQDPDTYDSDSMSVNEQIQPAPEPRVNWTKRAKKSVDCPQCGVRVTQNHLKVHMRIHTGERPYQCDICLESFSLKSTWIRHKRKHNNERTFVCKECGMAFRMPSDLRQHVKTHFLERPFLCSLCPKTFARSGDRSVHMRMHTGNKPYLCQECGKSFAMSTNFRKHQMLKHTDLKPFECQLCHKRFTFAGNLKIHMLIHTGEKNFLCTICGAKFTHKITLTRHLGIHTGERPYRCEVENCGKGFVLNSELRKHHRSSHGVAGKKVKSRKKKKVTTSTSVDQKEVTTSAFADHPQNINEPSTLLHHLNEPFSSTDSDIF